VDNTVLNARRPKKLDPATQRATPKRRELVAKNKHRAQSAPAIESSVVNIDNGDGNVEPSIA